MAAAVAMAATAAAAATVAATVVLAVPEEAVDVDARCRPDVQRGRWRWRTLACVVALAELDCCASDAMSPEPQRGWTGSRRRFASSSTSTAGGSEVRKGATSDVSSGECTRDVGTNISGTPCRWRASCVPDDHAFITSALSLARRRRRAVRRGCPGRRGAARSYIRPAMMSLVNPPPISPRATSREGPWRAHGVVRRRGRPYLVPTLQALAGELFLLIE